MFQSHAYEGVSYAQQCAKAERSPTIRRNLSIQFCCVNRQGSQQVYKQRIVLPVNKQPSRYVRFLITIFSPCFLSQPLDHFGNHHMDSLHYWAMIFYEEKMFSHLIFERIWRNFGDMLLFQGHVGHSPYSDSFVIQNQGQLPIPCLVSEIRGLDKSKGGKF